MTVEQVERQAEVSVHPYRKGDEAKIVPFLQECMSWPAAEARVPPLEHWRWKYLDNPLGFQLVSWAEQGSAVVSHCASIPVLMKVGGQTVLASQGVDLCTDPAFRGRGIIGQVMALRNQMKEDHGVALDFGFPNHAAYRLSLLKQGFIDLGIKVMQHRFIANEGRFFGNHPYGQIKRLGYGSYQVIRRSLRKRAENGFVLGHEERFDQEVDELYNEASARYDLMVARGYRYLNWRFSDARGGDFIIRTARRDGRLVGYMVHRLEHKEGGSHLSIVDALMEEGDDPLDALLSDVTLMAKDLGLDSVVCCLPEGHPYGKRMAEHGFLAEVRYTGDRPMSMIYLPRELDPQAVRLLSRGGLRAHVMLGDTDWV